MMNDTTSYLKLPLPHKDNYLEDDVPRLREALTGVDTFAHNADLRATEAEQELARKADAAATDNALIALGQRVAQVAEELAGGIPALSDAVDSAASNVAASSLAVKTAFDKGVAALALAESAEKDAQSALTLCSIPDWSDGLNYVGRCMVWHGEKIWLWRAPSGPGAGGVKTPGVAGSAAHWLDYAAAIAPVLQGGLIPVGHIALLPFRYNQLPFGWYFCNGTRYANTSPQGMALNALSGNFKNDWGISNNGSTTSVHNWFYGGRGPIMRAADGSSRQVGSVEDGAMQNITGEYGNNTVKSGWPPQYGVSSTSGWYGMASSGAFFPKTATAGGISLINDRAGQTLGFDASRAVLTANETRMLNRGMTPAIFLGV